MNHKNKFWIIGLIFVLLASMVSAVVNVNNTIIVYLPANLSTVANTTNSINLTLNGTGGNCSIANWNSSNPINVSWVYDSGNTTQFNYKSYNSSGLNVGLVEYLTMEDNLATTNVIDSINNRNLTATTNTNTLTVTGKNNLGFNLSTSNDLSVSIFNYTGNTIGTVNIWMKPVSLNRAWSYTGDTEVYFASNVPYWFCGGVLVFNGGTALNLNYWNMITVTHNGTYTAMYLNGSFINGTTSTCWFDNNNGVLRINNYFAGGSYRSNSLFDEFAIWNRGFSSSDVSELYNSGSGKFYNTQVNTILDSLINLSNGQYYYNVSCWDSALNNNSGNYYTFSVGTSFANPIISNINATSNDTVGSTTDWAGGVHINSDLLSITLKTDINANCSGRIDSDTNYSSSVAADVNYKFATTSTTDHAYTIYDSISVGARCLYVHCVDSTNSDYDTGSGCLNITRDASDTCSCSAINTNWNMLASDGCNITTACNLGTGLLNITGTGTVLLNSSINASDWIMPDVNSFAWIGNNFRLIDS